MIYLLFLFERVATKFAPFLNKFKHFVGFSLFSFQNIQFATCTVTFYIWKAIVFSTMSFIIIIMYKVILTVAKSFPSPATFSFNYGKNAMIKISIKVSGCIVSKSIGSQTILNNVSFGIIFPYFVRISLLSSWKTSWWQSLY